MLGLKTKVCSGKTKVDVRIVTKELRKKVDVRRL